MTSCTVSKISFSCLKKILGTSHDIAAEKILSRKPCPDYNTVAALFPQHVSWDFIATENSLWKYLVRQNGSIGIQTTFEGNYLNEIYLAFSPEKEGLPYASITGRQTLLKGYLPVSIIRFKSPSDSERWEQTSFACTDANGNTVIHIRVKAFQGKRKVLYFTVKPPENLSAEELRKLPYRKAGKLPDGKEFRSALLATVGKSGDILADALQISIPEKRVANACRAGLLKAVNTYVGGTPRYGATRYFNDSGTNSQSFPPTTVTMVNSCLEWNMFPRARRYLDYYLKHFTDSSGKLIHRDGGASVSEHGMVLDTAARYCLYTQEGSFIKEHWQEIHKICEFLLNSRLEGKRKPSGHPAFGLISGCPEDDLRKWKPNFWYSGNLWAYRGLAETRRVLKLYGQNSPPLKKYGAFLEKECRSFKSDIRKSLESSISSGKGLVFVPPYPKCRPFHSMMEETFYQGDAGQNFYLPSYVNYRVYPEMLSAGVLDRKLSNAVVRYRQERQGELLGLTRIRFPEKSKGALSLDKIETIAGGSLMLDDWPLYNYLWALLSLDMPEKFLMVYYAHMAYHQARETFFAPEHTDLLTLFPSHCVPSQLAIPLATRWMLVREERDADILWLSQAVPERWLKETNAVAVSGAPTRRGKINYTMETDSAGRKIILRLKSEEPLHKTILWRPGCGRSLPANDLSCKKSNVHARYDAEQNVLHIHPENNKTIEIVLASSTA